jgi:hypothetical protein
LTDALMLSNLVNHEQHVAGGSCVVPGSNNTQYYLHNGTDTADGWRFCAQGIIPYPPALQSGPLPSGWQNDWCVAKPGPGEIIGYQHGVVRKWYEGTDFIGEAVPMNNFNGVLRERYAILLTFLHEDDLPDAKPGPGSGASGAGSLFVVRYLVDQSVRYAGGVVNASCPSDALSGILFSYSTENQSLMYSIPDPSTYGHPGQPCPAPWSPQPCFPYCHETFIGEQQTTNFAGDEDWQHYSVQEYVTLAHPHGYGINLAHPYACPPVYGNFHQTADISASVNFNLIEMGNGVQGIYGGFIKESGYWDAVLIDRIAAGQSIPYGTATDDFCSPEPPYFQTWANGFPGRGCAIYSDSLDKQELLANAFAGNFYAWFSSQAPDHIRITEIGGYGGFVSLSVDRPATFNWFSGRIPPVFNSVTGVWDKTPVQTTEGVLSDTYTPTADDVYVRVEVSNNITGLATQPFLISSATTPNGETDDITATISTNQNMTVPIGWNV